MDMIEKASEASTMFEENNSELKKAYLIRYIQLYNDIVSSIAGYKGSFGTGYPFYALGKDMSGQLPVIEEQIRYNKEMIKDYNDYIIKQEHLLKKECEWHCESCLNKRCEEMQDIKSFCSNCPETPKSLRPRKIMNRLPDMDLWMIVEDGYEEVSEKKLIDLLNKYDLSTSDIDPIKTINDVYEIAEMLKKGQMPTKHIPIDTHIISYDRLYNLIGQVIPKINEALDNDRIPYIPILPYSLRKKWQLDDEAYNFVHDYLSSFTEFNFESNLLKKLKDTRKKLVNIYDVQELYRLVVLTGSDSVARRHQNLVLKQRFEERINLWKEL